MTGRRRRITAVTLGAAVAVGAVLGLAAPAQAHDYIASSTPAEGETLTALPADFSVTASATLLDLTGDGSGFGLQVTDAAGRFYGDGCVSIVDSTVSTPAALGEAGDYTLVWQFVSSDGHPTSGTIAFTWAPPADAVASAFAATRTAGISIIAGTTTPGNKVEIDPNDLVRRMLTIRGLHNYAPEDLVAAIDFLTASQDVVPFELIQGDVFPLSRIEDAFAASSERGGVRMALVP